MGKEFQLKVIGGTFQYDFPEVCVYCGKTKDTDYAVTINNKIELQIPYCSEHSEIAKARKSSNWSTVFVIAGAIPGAYWGWTLIMERGIFGIDEGPILIIFELLMAGVLGAITGMITGVIFESIVSLARRILGQPWEQPLGYNASYIEREKTLRLRFKDDEFANQFSQINNIT